MEFKNVGELRKGAIMRGVRFSLIVDVEQLHKLAEAANRYNTTISEIIRVGIGLILGKIGDDEAKDDVSENKKSTLTKKSIDALRA